MSTNAHGSEKMFYLIGLGLSDAEDITVKGLAIVKKCKRVYLEAYTSILTVGKDALVSYMSDNVISKLLGPFVPDRLKILVHE